MWVLSWGKPKIEIGKIEDNGVPFTWHVLPEIEKDSAKLLVEAGEKTEATSDDGCIIDSIWQINKYSFECELFVKKGNTKPVEDDDGIISDSYAIRLTPENINTEGFIMGRTIVSCEETWTCIDGKKWKYMFIGLTSVNGKVLSPYSPHKTFRFFSGNYLKFIKVNENSIFRFLIKK